ncbi:hypothetical protein D3C72_2436480 [compost metagenome]
MRQLVFDQRLRDNHKKGDAGAGIAAKRGGAVGHDPVALATWLGAGTKRHGVEVR